MPTKFFDKKLFQFIGLLVLSIGFNYFTTQVFASIFYAGTLIAYYYSEDEPFWLAYFLVLPAGFMGFFGLYSAVLKLIPGLPPIEVSQFYIILTFVKAAKKKLTYQPFYSSFLVVLFIYILFLIVQGAVLGFPPGMSKKFALLKMVLPMFLLVSIPRLFDSIKKYEECFKYLFFIAFTACFSQVFAIVNHGMMPSQVIGATEGAHLFFDVSEGYTYRGFFSPEIVLITFLGGMVFLALKLKSDENKNLYYAVLFANFLTAFLSATRGWILSFTIMSFLFLLFVIKLNPKRLIMMSLSGVLLFIVLINMPIVDKQIENAFNRLMTVEAMVQGDLSAGGTLSRFTKRGPKVMKQWEKSKLTGLGFSDWFRTYSDLHVGNQNILLHGGIIGAFLMFAFFAFFNYKLFERSINLRPGNPASGALLAFIFFFLGWFFIHSSSRQQFAFYSESVTGIKYALFFCFGTLLYDKARGYDPPPPQKIKEDPPVNEPEMDVILNDH